MTQNIALSNARKNKALSFKDLAKATSISRLVLYLYENGYVQISEKHIIILSKFFDVDTEYFAIGNGYPQITEDIPKDKFLKKIQKLTSNKFTAIVSSIIFILSIVSICMSFFMTDNCSNYSEGFYDKNYIALNNYVARYSEGVPSSSIRSMDMHTSIYNNDDSSKTFTIEVFTQSSNNKIAHINTNLRTTILKDEIIYSINYTNSSFATAEVLLKKYSKKYSCLFKRTGKELKFISIDEQDQIIDGALSNDNLFEYVEVNNDTIKNSFLNIDDENFKEVSKLITDNIEECDSTFDLWNNDNPKLNVSFDEILNEQTKGNESYFSYYDLGIKLLLIGATFAVVSFIVLGLFLYFLLITKHKIHALSCNNSYFPEIDGRSIRKRAYLNNNLSIFPFLPEFAIRFCCLLILGIGSSGLMVILGSGLQIFPYSINDATYFYKIANVLVSIAIFGLFFCNMDVLQNTKNPWTSIILTFVGGAVFYVFEVVMIYDLRFGGNQTLDLLTDYFPGNILWGMCTFKVLNLFLFYNPNFENNKRRKTIIFRCFSLIPVIYLAICLIYTSGRKLGGWSMPYYFSSLLFSKSFPLSIFILTFSFAVYFYRLYVVKKYGKDESIIYFSGNKYQFVRNILTSCIILLIGIFELIFMNNQTANAIGIGKYYFIILLIPFIMFYHSHFGERNIKMDRIYRVLYVLAFSVSYIFIAAIIIMRK